LAISIGTSGNLLPNCFLDDKGKGIIKDFSLKKITEKYGQIFLTAFFKISASLNKVSTA
jgi:hypothetical protein